MAAKNLLAAAKSAPLSKQCAIAATVVVAAGVVCLAVGQSRKAVHEYRFAKMRNEEIDSIMNKGEGNE